MTQIIHTTIPSRAPQAGTIYLTEIFNPHTKARYLREADLDACSMADVVDLIVDGDCENPSRVLAMDIAGSESWDASMAVAAVVLGRVLAAYDRIPSHCEVFLETHLGIHNVRNAEAEYREAA